MNDTKHKKGTYQTTPMGELVSSHRSRITGARIVVLRATPKLGEGGRSKWVNLCLGHRIFRVFDTRAEAVAYSTHSYRWCEGCEQAVIEAVGSGGKIPSDIADDIETEDANDKEDAMAS